MSSHAKKIMMRRRSWLANQTRS